jgi:hypothetical protein
VRNAIAKLQQQNAELLQQNENRVEEALAEYDKEFDVYRETVFNVMPLLGPTELGPDFEARFTTPAQADFFKRLKDQPKLYDKARGMLEHKLQTCFAILQQQFLNVVAATAQSHLKDVCAWLRNPLCSFLVCMCVLKLAVFCCCRPSTRSPRGRSRSFPRNMCPSRSSKHS